MRLDHLLSKETVQMAESRICVVFKDNKNHDKSESSLLFNFECPFGEKPRRYGGVAQLGEHLPCKQGVKGSNPFISTNNGESAMGS